MHALVGRWLDCDSCPFKRETVLLLELQSLEDAQRFPLNDLAGPRGEIRVLAEPGFIAAAFKGLRRGNIAVGTVGLLDGHGVLEGRLLLDAYGDAAEELVCIRHDGEVIADADAGDEVAISRLLALLHVGEALLVVFELRGPVARDLRFLEFGVLAAWHGELAGFQ